MNIDYAAWIKSARERLQFLSEQRDVIDTEIAALEQSIRNFEPLVGASTLRFGTGGGSFTFPDIQDAGMTDAIRAVFRMNPEHVMAPTDVRDMLLHFGFNLSGRQNAMANIHEVIRRLHKTGEIEHIQSSGKSGFRWAGLGAPPSVEETRPDLRTAFLRGPDLGKKK